MMIRIHVAAGAGVAGLFPPAGQAARPACLAALATIPGCYRDARRLACGW